VRCKTAGLTSYEVGAMSDRVISGVRLGE
jgi:hypothetical protein